MTVIHGTSGASAFSLPMEFSFSGSFSNRIFYISVRLLRRYVAPQVKVKAAGGIASLEDAEQFLQAGADRLGTSRIVAAAKLITHQ